MNHGFEILALRFLTGDMLGVLTSPYGGSGLKLTTFTITALCTEVRFEVGFCEKSTFELLVG